MKRTINNPLARLSLAGLLLLNAVSWFPATAAGGAALTVGEPRPLPDFALTAIGGGEIRSAQLSSRDKWLFVYIEPSCGAACAEVLRVFRRDGEAVAEMSQKVVIVVGGRSTIEAQALAGKYPWLSAASWYADVGWQARTALGLKGTPAVLGIGAGQIEWQLAGALEPKKLESILMTWCEGL